MALLAVCLLHLLLARLPRCFTIGPCPAPRPHIVRLGGFTHADPPC